MAVGRATWRFCGMFHAQREKGMGMSVLFGVVVFLFLRIPPPPPVLSSSSRLLKFFRYRTAYFFKRLNAWVGPKLGALAAAHGVAYDASKAHGAAYDVEVTTGCLVKIKQLGA